MVQVLPLCSGGGAVLFCSPEGAAPTCPLPLEGESLRRPPEDLLEEEDDWEEGLDEVPEDA